MYRLSNIILVRDGKFAPGGAMDSIMRDLYEISGNPKSIASYLDSLPFDVLAEANVPDDRVVDLFSVAGKFPVTLVESSFREMYQIFCERVVHPEDEMIYAAYMDPDTLLQRLENATPQNVMAAEFRVRLEDDTWRWVRQIVIGGAENDLPLGVVRIYVVDVQNLKDRELGLKSSSAPVSSAAYDHMTGLLRLKDFFAKVTSFFESNDATGWSLVTIDIDEFKLFNEWYGREEGDSVLARIGSYLSQWEQSHEGLVGYLGQDDFSVVLPYDEDAIEDLYADIAGIVADNTASMTFTPIFGVGMIKPGDDILDVLDRAVLAASIAKDDFKHRIRVFEYSMYEETDEEYRLLDDFQKALANHEITFFLQPQCRISNGKIVGVEALARWKKPDGTFVPPDKFIPVLEKFGFISDLDKYIWEDVCAHLQAWVDSGHKSVPISVNVSKQDIYAFDIVEYFVALTEQYNIPHSMIKIEITESAYTDDSSVVGDTVQRLRDNGFVILMDDFGSGYSSLNMLDSLRVDVIKLDMLFMRTDDENKRKSMRIVESVINMAKTMDLMVITEGVETPEQTDFLRGLGCRYAQGFHFYAPMSHLDFERLIGDGTLVDDEGFSLKSNDEFRIREFLDRTVYSDSMLNSILGPVAMYSWDGDAIDITRFNEQFYEAVGIREFSERLSDIQNYVVERDRGRLANLLELAMSDELNGSTGVIRFLHPDNTTADFLMRFFYIGEESGVRKFYGSVRDVTDLNELKNEMELLSSVTDKSVVFLKKQDDRWRYRVEIHGLGDELGLNREELQRELDEGVFYDRIDASEARMLKSLQLDSGEVDDHFTLSFGITNTANERLELNLRFFCVEDETSTFSYILVFQKK